MLPIEEILKVISGMGLLGADSLEGAAGAALGGAIPGQMISQGPEAAAAALMGGVAAPQIARQLPLGDIADAVGSGIMQSGAAGMALGAIPATRAMPAAAAASLAGGGVGGVMDEQEKMRRRLMGLYT
jgi:hypothetical protein